MKRKDLGSIPLRLSFHFKKVVVCGHGLVTYSAKPRFGSKFTSAKKDLVIISLHVLIVSHFRLRRCWQHSKDNQSVDTL